MFRFTEVIKQLPSNLGDNPSGILNELSASPPSCVLGRKAVRSWMKTDKASAQSQSPRLWMIDAAGWGKYSIAVCLAKHLSDLEDQSAGPFYQADTARLAASNDRESIHHLLITATAI